MLLGCHGLTWTLTPWAEAPCCTRQLEPSSMHDSARQWLFWPVQVHAFQAMQQGPGLPHGAPGCSTEASAMLKVQQFEEFHANC